MNQRVIIGYCRLVSVACLAVQRTAPLEDDTQLITSSWCCRGWTTPPQSVLWVFKLVQIEIITACDFLDEEANGDSEMKTAGQMKGQDRFPPGDPICQRPAPPEMGHEVGITLGSSAANLTVSSSKARPNLCLLPLNAVSLMHLSVSASDPHSHSNPLKASRTQLHSCCGISAVPSYFIESQAKFGCCSQDFFTFGHCNFELSPLLCQAFSHV